MLRGARGTAGIGINDIKQCSFMTPENIVHTRTTAVLATNFICVEQTLFAAASRRARRRNTGA
jgi:hypothetical protein